MEWLPGPEVDVRPGSVHACQACQAPTTAPNIAPLKPTFPGEDSDENRGPTETARHSIRRRASSTPKARMVQDLRFPCDVSRISPLLAVSSSAASTTVTMSYGPIVQ